MKTIKYAIFIVLALIVCGVKAQEKGFLTT